MRERHCPPVFRGSGNYEGPHEVRGRRGTALTWNMLCEELVIKSELAGGVGVGGGAEEGHTFNS